MTFKYNMTLERDGETFDLYPVVEFSNEQQPYYGNGYHMIVRNIGLEPFNIFDCRYDNRLDKRHLERFFPEFAKGRWTGANGSAKLVRIEEDK